MYELMNNHDLNMYYGGTYMLSGERVVFVESVNGERSSACAVLGNGESIPMSELQTFFPEKGVLVHNKRPVVLEYSSSRSYKKSFTGAGSTGGNRRAYCESLALFLSGATQTLQEALESSVGKNGTWVFGVSRKFYFRRTQDYSVPVLYYMNHCLGVILEQEQRIVITEKISKLCLERLVKNAGGYNVDFE